MDYATSTQTTAERAGLPGRTAKRIEHATLQTLAERISGGEAQDLAAQLREGAGQSTHLRTVIELDSPHVVVLLHPDEVAASIESAATGVKTRPCSLTRGTDVMRSGD